MPQLDLYIIINQIIYVFIFFFFLYFLIDKFVLPYLLIRLKTRQKFLETIFYQASELNNLSTKLQKYIYLFFSTFFTEFRSIELINYPLVPRLSTGLMLYMLPIKSSLIASFYDIFLSYYLSYGVISETFCVIALYNLLRETLYSTEMIKDSAVTSRSLISDELTLLIYTDLELNLSEIE